MPHYEPVLLVRELNCPNLISPELVSQYLHVLSSLLGCGLVVSTGVEVGRGFDRLHELGLVATIEVLDIERRMDGSNGLYFTELS